MEKRKLQEVEAALPDGFFDAAASSTTTANIDQEYMEFQKSIAAELREVDAQLERQVQQEMQERQRESEIMAQQIQSTIESLKMKAKEIAATSTENAEEEEVDECEDFTVFNDWRHRSVK